jgi:hypothetical protein
MKTYFIFGLSLLITATALQAQPPRPVPPSPPPQPPPPVAVAPLRPVATDQFVYEQKPMAGRPYLVTPEQAQNVVNRFKEAYPKMGSPRVVIYINRELVDEDTGMKLSARRQETESVRGGVKQDLSLSSRTGKNSPGNSSVATINGSPASTANQDNSLNQTDRVTSKNNYRVQERKQQSLADKQTVRDVERLFGRPLRLAGVTLVDQRLATQLTPDKPVSTFTPQTEGEAVRKDREALAKIADVVVEVLISSRQVTVPELSGDKVYAVPDIQVTALRLSDAKILGQATAADLLDHAGKVAKNFGVREITEATALSLMEDMLQ